MSLKENITSLRTMLDQCEKEVQSLSSGRKVSATHARKSLQNIKASCQGLRKSITEHTKSLPTKTRTKKEIICPSHAANEAEEEELEAKAEQVEQVEEVVTEPVKTKRVRKTKAKAV
jgi:hypothetical protein